MSGGEVLRGRVLAGDPPDVAGEDDAGRRNGLEGEQNEGWIELGEGAPTAVQCNPRETVEEDRLSHVMGEDPECPTR